MNVMTKLLNALAFANVGNQGEFNALLRQIESQPASGQDQARRGSASPASGASSVAPGIGHAQGAL